MYSCPLCTRSYPVAQKLREHFIIHLQNNPFVCQISGCGVKFRNKWDLQRHILQHIKIMEETEEDGIIPGTNGNGKDTRLIKGEDEDEVLRIEVGSEHLDADDIDDDGEDEDKQSEGDSETNWVKLESLSKPRTGSDNEEDNEESNHQKSIRRRRIGAKSLSLRCIMLKDPVYLKLASENPEAAALVLPKKHFTLSMDGQTFKCPLCSWRAIRKSNLPLHMKRVHYQDVRDDDIQAEVVPLCRLPVPVEIEEPPTATTPTPLDPLDSTISLLCGKCGYQSTSFDDLANHMSQEHPIPVNNSYACNYCGVGCKTLISRKKHEQKVHFSEKKYSCLQCPRKYSKARNLKLHVRAKHEPLAPVNCDICEEQFPNARDLKKHKLNSHSEPISCKLCGGTYTTKVYLQRHVRSVHLGVKLKWGGRGNKGKEQPGQESSIAAPQNVETDNEILGF